MCELMLEALKSEARKLNQLAAESLVLTGPIVVHELVREVLTTKRIGYRVRLLGVIEAIGEVPEPADQMELFNLAQDKDSLLRAAAARTIFAVGPHGPKRQTAVQVAEQPC